MDMDLSGLGLDRLMIRFAEDVVPPAKILLALFFYITGLWLALAALIRLKRKNEQGSRAAPTEGIAMSFVVAAVLISAGASMDAFANSIFGASRSAGAAVLAYTVGDSELTGHVNAMISSVFMFIELVGWAYFAKGWMVLQEVADGNNQHTGWGGTIRLLAGVCAVHLYDFIEIVQGTFHLEILRIT